MEASLCVGKGFTRTRQGQRLISGLSPDEWSAPSDPPCPTSQSGPEPGRLAGFRLLDFTPRLSSLRVMYGGHFSGQVDGNLVSYLLCKL